MLNRASVAMGNGPVAEHHPAVGRVNALADPPVCWLPAWGGGIDAADLWAAGAVRSPGAARETTGDRSGGAGVLLAP